MGDKITTQEHIFLQVIQDDMHFQEVTNWFTNRAPISSSTLRKLLAKFKSGISNSFPYELQNWIVLQLGPYLTPAGRGISNSFDVSQAAIAPNQLNDEPKNTRSTKAVDQIIHRELTISDIPITSKVKQKKRVKSNVIESTIDLPKPSALFEVKIETISKKTSTPSVVESIGDLGVQDTDTFIMTDSLHVLQPSSTTTTTIMEETKANFHPDEISLSASQASSGGKNILLTLDLGTLLFRLSTLYAQLVLMQHLPLQPATVLLSKLCSYPWQEVNKSSMVPVSNLILDSRSNLSSVILFPNVANVAEFTVRSLELLLPLISRMSSSLLTGFAACPALRVLAPASHAAYLAAAEDEGFDQVTMNTNDLFSMYLPETFIRPFREETDSRLEYTTQVDTVGYTATTYVFIAFVVVFAVWCL